MFTQLFKNKDFFALFSSRFLSALNEGFIRIVFLFFVTYNLTRSNPMFMISAVILYALSFCGATIYIGQLADKFSKGRVLRAVRICEIIVMSLALFSLFLDSRLLLTFILIFLGMINACLRVLDNSLIMEITTPTKYNQANILIKTGVVFASALSCLLLTSVLKFEVAYEAVCIIGLIASVISFIITLKLPLNKPADKELSFTKSPYKTFEFVSSYLKHRFDMWAYLVGIAWFWMMASVTFFLSAEYGRSILHARWSVVEFLYAGVFTLGFILGAVFYAHLSRKNNMGSYTSIVGLLLSLFLFNFVVSSSSLIDAPQKALTIAQMLTGNFAYWCVLIDVCAIGALSAFFILPYYSLIQLKTPAHMSGRMFAFSNMLNALSIVTMFLILQTLMLFSLYGALITGTISPKCL